MSIGLAQHTLVQPNSALLDTLQGKSPIPQYGVLKHAVEVSSYIDIHRR